MKKVNRAAIYCRNSDTYGTFEPKYPHNSIAYQAGSAMALIIDKGLDFAGLYVDEDGTSSMVELIEDYEAGSIDAVIVRDISIIENSSEGIQKLDEMPILFIGAEDRYYTEEDFDFDTFKMVRTSDEGMTFGPVLYGYQKDGDRWIADPETAPVVRQIFELAREGHGMKKITDYLNYQNIPSPGRGRSWNAPSVRNYLRRKEYYGNSKVEAIISERLFDEVQEVLEEKRVIRADDPFPMIRCDVCNGRLIYQKAGDIPRLKTSSYKCDKHTGTKPSKGRLETAPKITEEALTKIVLDRYNEYLDQATEEFESDDSRAEKVMELGEKVLKGEEIGEEYSGLWAGLWDGLYNSIQNTERLLIKRFFHHMDEYDPEVGKRVIKSLRLTSDGKVKVKFWGE